MPFTLVLILIVFILALVWLLNWEPDKDEGARKKKDKDEKTLREEIEGVFKDLKSQAVTYKRDECIPSLDTAHHKVLEVLRKRELVES